MSDTSEERTGPAEPPPDPGDSLPAPGPPIPPRRHHSLVAEILGWLAFVLFVASVWSLRRRLDRPFRGR
jgi:hypothetical protein